MAPFVLEMSQAAPAASDAIACRCMNVAASRVVEVIESGQASTVREITRCTRAGAACMACHCRLKRLLAQHRPAMANQEEAA